MRSHETYHKCKETLYNSSQGFWQGKPRDASCPPGRQRQNGNGSALYSQVNPRWNSIPPLSSRVILASDFISPDAISAAAKAVAIPAGCVDGLTEDRGYKAVLWHPSVTPTPSFPPDVAPLCESIGGMLVVTLKGPTFGVLPNNPGPFHRYVRDVATERETDTPPQYILKVF